MKYEINLKHNRWENNQRVFNIEEFAPPILLCNDDLYICSNPSINQKHELNDTFNTNYKFENSLVGFIWSVCSITLLDDAKSNVDPRDSDHNCLVNALIQKHESLFNKRVFSKMNRVYLEKGNIKIVCGNLIAIWFIDRI